jgi:hypothetical protein
MLTLRTINAALPHPPPDIAEEVELYARESGRTAKLHFVPGGGWLCRFSLRCNDPRMKLYQEGKASEPPSEDVWFHVPNPKAFDGQGAGAYIPLDIVQMGRSGVREFLERGNTWSGRGIHSSTLDALQSSEQLEQDRKDKLYRSKREGARERARDLRRLILKIPFHRVGIDLGGKTKE